MKLVTIYSKTKGFPRFQESVEKHRKFEWVKVELPIYPGNTKRWEFLPKGLDGHIIFTDTDDVIMQRSVPNMPGIVTAPENVLHKDSFWKEYCVGEYEILLDKPVYNAGMFAMPSEELYELAKFILDHEGNDQLSFNLWLLGKNHTPDLGTFLPLYNNLGNADKINGVWVVDNVIPCFVHANGNNKDKL